MKHALLAAIKPAVRTLAQTLAGSLGALGVAEVGDFAYVPDLALVLLWGAVIATFIAFLQNFAEGLSD